MKIVWKARDIVKKTAVIVQNAKDQFKFFITEAENDNNKWKKTNKRP
jgi:hypothetical protein